LDRYGAAINADFRSLFGVRLIDFFADVEPWGEFWRLLGQLGADSRYVKAQQNDPEVADLLASQESEDDPQEWKPQAQEWTLLHELVARLGDRQGDVAALIADLPVGVKTRHTPPPAFPRPETELDKARKRIAAEREQQYDDKVIDLVERAKQRYREQGLHEQQ
jgi:hypothetical protein